MMSEFEEMSLDELREIFSQWGYPEFKIEDYGQGERLIFKNGTKEVSARIGRFIR